MFHKVDFGFDWQGQIVRVGDVVKSRFTLVNPWLVMEIYATSDFYYVYHIGKGTKTEWVNEHDIEFVSRDIQDAFYTLAN